MRYEGKLTWEKYIAAKKEINDEIWKLTTKVICCKKKIKKLKKELNELECECDITIREKGE